jgi:S-adenosylmethionine synthetase
VRRRARYDPSIEVVERKGAGHPDTLCDRVAEQLACRVSALHLDRTGAVRHVNVDKGLLVGGAAELGFGGGRRLRPFQVIIAGRADLLDGALDVEELASWVRRDLQTVLPDAEPGSFELDLRLNPPAPELARLVAGAGDTTPRANDTSVAVVSLPRSPLEDAVLRVEQHLNSPALRRRLPLGPDVKVMGVRTGTDTALTVAAPVLANCVDVVDAYESTLRVAGQEAATTAEEALGQPVTVTMNASDGGHPYLTLCGSSAEAGDDGQVGRGNRFGGLITPGRSMSLEACAGKNPVAHVGKTYHAVAHDIAEDVLCDLGAEEVTVTIVSRIGDLVTSPRLVDVDIAGDADPTAVAQITQGRLADWQGVRDRLLAGHYPLF